MNDDIPELTAHQFSRALSSRTRQRLISGDFHGGKDIQALRRFIALSQSEFAEALGISVHTLRNWEQDRRRPEGPALALLSVAARNPRVLRERVSPAATRSDPPVSGSRGPMRWARAPLADDRVNRISVMGMVAVPATSGE